MVAETRRTTHLTNLEIKENLILPNDSGFGIKSGGTSAEFGWRDLEGPIRPRDTGVGKPTLSVWRTPIREYSFAANDIVELTFHIPHDWAVGTDLYIHTHWSHTGTTIANSLVLNYIWTYAKGHNQAVFPAVKTLDHTIATPNIATYPQYQHIISETQLSASSPSATQLDTDNIEVDGLIIAQVTPTAIPTLGGGGLLFIHYVDIHYQSTSIGTRQKAPNFYAD